MIYTLIGKSASGKDHIYESLINDKTLALSPFVIYTTRPMREGEKNGREYFFTDTDGLSAMRSAGKVIEERVYHTVKGDWYYFTADNDSVSVSENSYLGIGTLESYVKLRDYYGKENVCPLYIEVDPALRLERSINREREQKTPNYKEVCRRFIADEDDFSEEKLKAAGIDKRFENNEEITICVSRIADYIKSPEGRRT